MTVDTDEGTLVVQEENVRSVIGPECSLDAAEMADKVAGANESPEVGSATTSVDWERNKLELSTGRDEW
jgi:hypothetical protein